MTCSGSEKPQKLTHTLAHTTHPHRSTLYSCCIAQRKEDARAHVCVWEKEERLSKKKDGHSLDLKLSPPRKRRKLPSTYAESIETLYTWVLGVTTYRFSWLKLPHLTGGRSQSRRPFLPGETSPPGCERAPPEDDESYAPHCTALTSPNPAAMTHAQGYTGQAVCSK